MRHLCDMTPHCAVHRPHMWFYGGWRLQRPDHTGLRIWKGKVQEIRRDE